CGGIADSAFQRAGERSSASTTRSRLWVMSPPASGSTRCTGGP
ncbi:MAG: hypothetical protein AVDCRST_MAG26-107, partial [uncultured Chloroflexia bacterium]